jgi:hypothetical protein
MSRRTSIAGLCLVLGFLTLADPTRSQDRRPGPDFRSEVWPIFKQHCVECHGSKRVEGGLRIDSAVGWKQRGDSGSLFDPDDHGNSELLRRIQLPASDPARMPAVGEPLSPARIQILKDWLAAGGQWPDDFEDRHWAYVAPQSAQPPDVNNAEWCQNAVDRFVLVELERRGWAPSPPAERATLLRRVAFDLTGLPPSRELAERFLSNGSPDAYQQLVDELLASPAFGERWARPWLDLARYADSHGFQRDDLRGLWPYRDWVIRAMNSDQPYDEFTLHQLAGDLIPDADEQSRIATGFHRSTPTNVEAGSDPEETRINQVFDRVNTTATVWMGVTMECAQCHDHKYDPFTQRDYYGLLAYFNSTELEADRSNPKVPGSIRFLGPTMAVRYDPTDRRRAELSRQLNAAIRRIENRKEELRQDLNSWTAEMQGTIGSNDTANQLLELSDFQTSKNSSFERLDDGSILLTGKPAATDDYLIETRVNGPRITGLRLETLTDDRLPGKGPGRGESERPNFVLNSFRAWLVGESGREPLEFVEARASFSQKNLPVSGAIDDDPKTGWAINPRFHESHWAEFRLQVPIDAAEGRTIAIELVQSYGGGRTIGRLRLSAMSSWTSQSNLPDALLKTLSKSVESWSNEETAAMVDWRFQQDAGATALRSQQRDLEDELARTPVVSTLVMRELTNPRPTHRFERGDHRTPREEVSPGTPALFIGEHQNSISHDRAALARWLTSRDNPLVGRTEVNRVWAELFGRGLVATTDDFGVKGEQPSHPELLDWLAEEFRQSGWSRKHLLRVIVQSSTYRQSSSQSGDAAQRDPENIWLSRGPRVRLPAETIRDQALALAGLLSDKMYGPPVRPPQPDGLWKKVGGEPLEYEVSPGEDRSRRGIYIVWKRASPYPSLMNFDATARLACQVTRSRTNTPMQALTLLNDPVYVEAARALAERLRTNEASRPLEKRLQLAFEHSLIRSPDREELAVFIELWQSQRDATGEESAWQAVATALLNLDETITKE